MNHLEIINWCHNHIFLSYSAKILIGKELTLKLLSAYILISRFLLGIIKNKHEIAFLRIYSMNFNLNTYAMRTFLVIIQLKDPQCDTSAIYNILNIIGDAAQVTDTSFLINTNEDAVFLRDRLKANKDIIRLFVTQARLPAAWKNVIEPSREIKRIFHEPK